MARLWKSQFYYLKQIPKSCVQATACFLVWGELGCICWMCCCEADNVPLSQPGESFSSLFLLCPWNHMVQFPWGICSGDTSGTAMTSFLWMISVFKAVILVCLQFLWEKWIISELLGAQSPVFTSPQDFTSLNTWINTLVHAKWNCPHF